MLRLIGPGLGDADVSSLSVGEFCEADTERVEVKPGNFLVESLRKAVDVDGKGLLPKFDLSKGLVSKRIRHNERRVAGSATEIDEATLGQHEDRVAGA